MKSGFITLLSILIAIYLIMILSATSIRAYPTGPDPGATGGFGESTCNRSGCHNTFELNAGRALGLGDVVIAGVPKQYEPSKTYPITVTVTHTQERKHWGFQLAARVKTSGAQAGELKPTDSNTQIVEEKGIQYIEHTEDGIQSNTFEFQWVAPSSPAGKIIMHAAGNAADGDITPVGDYIYSTSVATALATKGALVIGEQSEARRRP